MAETTMSAVMATADDRSLIRKVLRAVAFLAPTTVALPTTIVGTTGALEALPAGWLPVGLVTPDGYTFGNEVEKEDVDALGYASPVRSDITRAVKSVSFTALQSGVKHMEELYYGVDLSAVEQSAVGEVVFDEPELPVGAEYRLLVIAADGPADKEWLLGRGYPLVKLANLGEETWGREGAVQREVTLDVFTDDTLGTPVRHYMGGTGALAAADALGYEA